MIWFFIACIPNTVLLSSDLVNQDQEQIPNPFIQIYDVTGSLYAEVEGDPEGSFQVDVPANADIFVVISADDYDAHSFSGLIQSADIAIETGIFWLRTEEEATAIRSEFSDCSSTNGSFIDGQIRLMLDTSNPENNPTITTATFSTVDDTGSSSACYLPELDPETEELLPSEKSGAEGRFALFGLSAGLHTLNVNIQKDEATSDDYSFNVFVPENGSVPLYPLFIPVN